MGEGVLQESFSGLLYTSTYRALCFTCTRAIERPKRLLGGIKQLVFGSVLGAIVTEDSWAEPDRNPLLAGMPASSAHPVSGTEWADRYTRHANREEDNQRPASEARLELAFVRGLVRELGLGRWRGLGLEPEPGRGLEHGPERELGRPLVLEPELGLA